MVKVEQKIDEFINNFIDRKYRERVKFIIIINRDKLCREKIENELQKFEKYCDTRYYRSIESKGIPLEKFIEEFGNPEGIVYLSSEVFNCFLSEIYSRAISRDENILFIAKKPKNVIKLAFLFNHDSTKILIFEKITDRIWNRMVK